jgi:hypothetical protein
MEHVEVILELATPPRMLPNLTRRCDELQDSERKEIVDVFFIVFQKVV